jgi:diguanylate cyclase (GGDEF)-like protein/PAS domain S-box-containing protein
MINRHHTAQDSPRHRFVIRRREYRAIAFLLVLGMVIWMVESFLAYAFSRGDDFLGPLGPHLHAHAIFIPVIGILCFIGYGIYITKILVDVRRAEQELQESEERYRLLTQNSLTGIFIHEASILVYVNERLAEILGYSPSELLGKELWDFVDPEDRSLVADREEARSQGRDVVPQYEFRVVCKTGEVKWVEILAAAITHLGRSGGMGNLADVTERKKHESERETLISDLEQARDALHFQATHDALTGLLNRSAVLDALKREAARAAREGGSLATIMVDVDHFKAVNDTYGHLAGDAVLQEIARRIRFSVRTYDLVGRYGGEEILVGLPGCDASGAEHFAERVRLAVSAKEVQTREGAIAVTVSLGVACVAGANVHDLEIIIRQADEALYRAKEAGRNRSVMASQGLTSICVPQPPDESELGTS